MILKRIYQELVFIRKELQDIKNILEFISSYIAMKKQFFIQEHSTAAYKKK